MRMDNVGRVVMVAVLLGALVVTVGCSASRGSSRANLVEAENVDLMQRAQTAEQQRRDAQLAQDRTTLDLQQEKHRLAQLGNRLQSAEEQAAEGQMAVVALDRSRADHSQNIERLKVLTAEVDRLAQIAKSKPPEMPAAPPSVRMDPSSPHLEAFAQDLRGRLRSSSIDLPVEIRRTRDGRSRVAVVQTNAFPPGKDSLSYNMDAVRAVVGLGQLIARSYPGSRVSVEGHTDSDPIKASGKRWSSNTHLSQARAESVKTLLVKSGVRSDLIETVGSGASHPIDSGTTKRAKARNRRVEIYIEPRT